MALVACSPRDATRQLSGQTMGTTWSVQLSAAELRQRPALEPLIQAQLDAVVAQMSTWEPESLISRYNRADPGSWHELPDAMAHVVTRALTLAERTGGAYDPTVGPLVEAWGFGPGHPRDTPPAADAIAAARDAVGWWRLVFDDDRQRLLQPGSVRLDLSSIAKGHAVDMVAEALLAAGIHDFLVEVGGETRAHGRRPDGRSWRVAIQSPLPDAPGIIDVIDLDGLSAATSGDYRMGFRSDGRWYSHLIDPRTGEPVRHRLASVTVVHRESLHADALATALMVLGPDRGMHYAEREDLAVLMVEHGNDGMTIHRSRAFEALSKKP